MSTVAPAVVSPSTAATLWHAALPSADEVRRARRRLHAQASFTVILAGFSYWALVIADFDVAIRLGAAAVFVASLVAVGTGIMHGANHGSFSTMAWLNRALSWSMDLLGGSSWLWRFKHNHLHHGNPNVVGVDSDIEQSPFARLAPSQLWRARHRYQHLYLWFLYGFMNLRNLLVGDWSALRTGGIGGHEMREQPTRRVAVRMVTGKAAHVTWALAVPMLFNPWPAVLLFYVACSWGVGIILAVVFQMAHCVDLAEIPDPDEARRGDCFVEFQMRTTVNIASPSVAGGLFRWLAGGLDYQVEHHLAPRLPHTVYASVARRFHGLCLAAGIEPARRHSSVIAAIRSHTRWLRAMGRQPALV